MIRGNRPVWIQYMGIGTEFAGAVIGFTLVGLWVDWHWQIGPWGILVGVTLGLVGGMYNLVRRSLSAVRSMNKDGGTDSTQADPPPEGE